MKTIKKRIRYRNDVFFKYALANDDENSTFIRNTIIEEITGIKPMESIVLNPNMDSIFIDKKGVILDVHIKDKDGVEYDIEMQTTMIGDTEMKRFEFYGARMINNQLDKGENYSLLKQVYQIIFVESLPKGNRELINSYQMRTARVEVEYEKALLHRIYVHLPIINEIAKKKRVKEMSAMEQLCYLFENNENDDILESDKRLVKAIMEKYKKMQDDNDLWSTAMAIEMGEMRVQNWIDDSFEMGKEAGIKEGKREGEHTVLEQLIQKRYRIDASSWLSTLNEQQIANVTDELLSCESFEELQRKVFR